MNEFKLRLTDAVMTAMEKTSVSIHVCDAAAMPQLCQEIAVAVVEAAKTPTDDMLVEGQKRYADSIIAGHKPDYAPLEGKLAAVEPFHLRAGWLGMLDAALKDEP